MTITDDSKLTCAWYVSIDQPECGEEAHERVTVQNRVTKATIALCPEHKAIHDRSFASLRTARVGKGT